MKSKKILMISLVALLTIITVGSCSAGVLDAISSDSGDVGTITIDCGDTARSGVLMVIEYKDIKQNDNGTFNTSQFGNNEGEWNGNVVYIPINEGKAEYNLTAGTEMFAVDSYIMNITPECELGANDTPTFDAKYLYKGEEALSSSEQQYLGQCDVSFGGNIYYLNGTGLTEDDICIDLPNLKESHDTIMDLYNVTEE